VIDRNIKEAVLTINEVLNRKLTASETRKIANKRERELKARVKEMRIREAERVLPVIASKAPRLETPQEFERAAEVLKEKAKEMREGTLKPEEIKKMARRIEEAEPKREEMEEDMEEISMQTVKSLREKIEALEKEKVSLLEKKGFLTEALSFNCPHCNHSCMIYREGDGYWVE